MLRHHVGVYFLQCFIQLRNAVDSSIVCIHMRRTRRNKGRGRSFTNSVKSAGLTQIPEVFQMKQTAGPTFLRFVEQIVAFPLNNFFIQSRDMPVLEKSRFNFIFSISWETRSNTFLKWTKLLPPPSLNREQNIGQRALATSSCK